MQLSKFRQILVFAARQIWPDCAAFSFVWFVGGFLNFSKFLDIFGTIDALFRPMQTQRVFIFVGTFFWFIASFSSQAEGTPFFPQSVASGDPTHDSVVLWTRLVADGGDNDRVLGLTVTAEGDLGMVGSTAKLEGVNLYSGPPVPAPTSYDGCAKVRVTGLSPNQFYYYQFAYEDNETLRRSAIGRTWTAPEASDSAPIRFAVFNCSDYSGRYYNTLKHLNEQEAENLNFVLHLGDYIYETTADPSFQTVDDERSIAFSEPEEAIQFANFLAAKSLSNYRDLYKSYRSDPHLLRAHELFPWVVIWDDHEYSDDHYGSVATYFDGKAAEENAERKKSAERAWMEFIPAAIGLDVSGNGLSIGSESLYPNTKIYRALNFGKNLDLILTDSRTKRPDHLVPENAFPGTIVMDQEASRQTVEAVRGAGTFPFVRNLLDPYFNIDGEQSYFGQPAANSALPSPAFAGTPFAGLNFKQALTAIVTQQAAQELAGLPEVQAPSLSASDYAAAVVKGNLSADWVNRLFAAAGFPQPLPESELDSMERGVSYFFLGKTANFSDLGSRYQLVNASFELYAGYTYQAFLASGGELGRDQAFYEPEQLAFLQSALQGSVAGGRSWRVVGSSVPFSPIRLNLSDSPEGVSLPNTGRIVGEIVGTQNVPQEIPEEFMVDLLINADELAGFPNFRQGVIDSLAAADAIILSGDIHASMLGENAAANGEKVIDFTAPSSSSSNFRRAFSRALQTIEGLIAPGYRTALKDPSIQFEFHGKEEFLSHIDKIVVHNSPEISYLNTETHGYLVAEASADIFAAEYREIDVHNIALDRADEAQAGLNAVFTRRPYSVSKSGTDVIVTPGPVIVALSKRFHQIKVGEQVVIPYLATQPGANYQILFSTKVDGETWTPISESDYVAVDGALLESDRIVGNGNTVSVVVKIPQALAEANTAFFLGKAVQ